MLSRGNKSNRSRSTAAIHPKLNRNLAAYMAAAGAAGVSMLALAQPADAKVIYTSDYQRLGEFLDINHDGIVDFPIRAYGFCISGEGYSLCGQSFALNASSPGGRFMGTSGVPLALRAGAQIGPSAQFTARAIVGSDFKRYFSGTNAPPNWFGPFANGGKGVRDRYLGLKFTIGKESHYGWLRISVHIPNSQKAGFDAFITGYAYETDANKAIVAGQETGTSEASSNTQSTLGPNDAAATATLGALARGAQSLSLWRREGE
jgi:hypothetical protein